ncbi:helix-turn-helix domain-containing protein [Glutamicibacter sp. MNS18]|uniref:helix-turn-helix domain-containing protein n=1 Tax=Glutamicibacter sp. MNS18 TaxID=2989817 RepID=UPI002235A4F1|nr:helix-turn-helix domain-containing protein [Glutamicibacter sp. MNS18]MCW4464930.1 helix-turn-helix domain-containing protein [Glutamicibacter sp. MNS18]
MFGTIDTPSDLGRAVHAARLELGITQTELATALGYSQRYISDVETGKAKTLSANLFELLDQLGIQLMFRTVDNG